MMKDIFIDAPGDAMIIATAFWSNANVDDRLVQRTYTDGFVCGGPVFRTF